MPYLKNTWYPAGWDTDVPSGKPFSRVLLGQRIVMYRDSIGVAYALADRCPHRFVPLSLGVVDGDKLRCAYHGLEFDCSGACTRNPHGNGMIPKAAKVQAYPLVERHSMLWIWMGDPALADATSIPDFSASMDPVKRFVGKDYLLARAHYQLETDNIMDLSHIEFLHPGSLGSDAVRAAHAEVVQDGDTIHSRRLTHAERLPEALANGYGLPTEQLVDRWLDVRWNAPASMELWVGVAPTGSDDPRKVGKRIPFVHLFTPETETTTHYWFSTSYPRRMGQEGESRTAADMKFLRAPFEHEDLPMLEAQQESMGNADFWSLKPVLLSGDAAAVRARRVLDAMIERESAL